MPIKNKTRREAAQVMSNHKTAHQIAGNANLKLNKKQAAERADRQAAVRHVCPICSWDQEASRKQKKNIKSNERSH